MNKTIKYLLNKYGAEILPSNLWRAHIDDNVPISNDFYGADGRAEDDLADNMDTYKNKERDGSELSAEKDKEKDAQLEEDLGDKEIDDIKMRRIKHKEKKRPPALNPHPFYASMYNSLTGVEGLYTSPVEYYSGSIADTEPGAQTINPWQNEYQTASNSSIRIKIRASIFGDYTAPKIHIIDQEKMNKEELHHLFPLTESLKSLDEAKTIAHRLEREGHDALFILRGKTKHKWHDPTHPNYREEIHQWYQVCQL